jgi:anti-sigma regulatory factor (Ser/Thr protein kinase)
MTSELCVTYHLRRHPSEISRARELARKALTDWGLADHTDLAELIVSELTTNALRHGAGPITVRLSYTSDGDLWTEVHDHAPTHPVVQEVTRESERGRGLPLLVALSHLYGGSFGTVDDAHASGKTAYLAVVVSSVPMVTSLM